MLTINPKEVSVAVLHAYLQSSIAPRPIAFASTIDKDGNVNLSPFSFFNVFGTNPATLIFSPNRRVRDGSQKHTLENVLEHDEVVAEVVALDEGVCHLDALCLHRVLLAEVVVGDRVVVKVAHLTHRSICIYNT
jgi:flavin reductase (DIM6/NTAB) family NADH-FMN oxidoreductase RutF